MHGRWPDNCEPWLVASAVGGADVAAATTADLGLARPRRIDPFRTDSRPFVSLVQRLHTKIAGPIGLTIPRWALYDCGEVPGAIFGFSERADLVSSRARQALQVAGDGGQIPLSLVVMVPTLEPGAWHLFGLGSIGQIAGVPADTLRLPTLIAALATVGVHRASAVVRWTSGALHDFARLAPLELATAWTPAHSQPDSLTCAFDVTHPRLAAALAEDPPPPGPETTTIDAGDPDALRGLQAAIESGGRWAITGPPRSEGGRAMVPLAEAPS